MNLTIVRRARQKSRIDIRPAKRSKGPIRIIASRKGALATTPRGRRVRRVPRAGARDAPARESKDIGRQIVRGAVLPRGGAVGADGGGGRVRRHGLAVVVNGDPGRGGRVHQVGGADDELGAADLLDEADVGEHVPSSWVGIGGAGEGEGEGECPGTERGGRVPHDGG